MFTDDESLIIIFVIAICIGIVASVLAIGTDRSAIPSEEKCLHYNFMQIVSVQNATEHFCYLNEGGWHFNETKYMQSLNWGNTI